MDNESRRKEQGRKLLRNALKDLDQAAEILFSMGLDEAAIILRSQTEKVRTSATEILPLFGTGRITRVERHPLEIVLYELWKEVFPIYGEPSSRDKKDVREMFMTFSSAYPAADRAFLLRMVRNYKSSNAEWCETKEMHIFGRNFRKFALTPQMNENIVRQEGPTQARDQLGQLGFGKPGGH